MTDHTPIKRKTNKSKSYHLQTMVAEQAEEGKERETSECEHQTKTSGCLSPRYDFSCKKCKPHFRYAATSSWVHYRQDIQCNCKHVWRTQGSAKSSELANETVEQASVEEHNSELECLNQSELADVKEHRETCTEPEKGTCDELINTGNRVRTDGNIAHVKEVTEERGNAKETRSVTISSADDRLVTRTKTKRGTKGERKRANMAILQLLLIYSMFLVTLLTRVVVLRFAHSEMSWKRLFFEVSSFFANNPLHFVSSETDSKQCCCCWNS